MLIRISGKQSVVFINPRVVVSLASPVARTTNSCSLLWGCLSTHTTIISSKSLMLGS
jgi:hypothetical protein